MIVGVCNIYIGASVGSHVAMPRFKKSGVILLGDLSRTHQILWHIGRLK
jgi:hypothetical protein